jgi:hypothetical protein
MVSLHFPSLPTFFIYFLFSSPWPLGQYFLNPFCFLKISNFLPHSFPEFSSFPELIWWSQSTGWINAWFYGHNEKVKLIMATQFFKFSLSIIDTYYFPKWVVSSQNISGKNNGPFFMFQLLYNIVLPHSPLSPIAHFPTSSLIQSIH